MNEVSKSLFISHLRNGHPLSYWHKLFSEEQVRKEGREVKNETKCPVLKLDLHPIAICGTMAITHSPDNSSPCGKVSRDGVRDLDYDWREVSPHRVMRMGSTSNSTLSIRPA